VVLLTSGLPDSQGLRPCQDQALASATPIVILTGLDDEKPQSTSRESRGPGLSPEGAHRRLHCYQSHPLCYRAASDPGGTQKLIQEALATVKR
jgi:hypothetical protein